MPVVNANGLSLAYETSGSPRDPPMLLIMGLGMPLVFWPDAFVDGLAARGFHVIRFDNRDCGHSQKIRGGPLPNIPVAVGRALLRLNVDAPYDLDDMAADAAGLLDALRIERAHVVGVSLGGMIAQTMAARHASRVASLTSIMSSSGNPRVSFGKPRALRALLQPPPNPHDIDAVVARMVNVLSAIGSPGYAPDRALLRQSCERVARRGYHPAGTVRQLFAILASGDRRRQLARITAPTLVIHGVEDPLLPVAGGRDVARHIPHARMMEIPGMGHDVPPALIPALVDAIAGHAAAVQGSLV